MRDRSTLISFVFFGLLLSAVPAGAQLSASYTVSSFDYNGDAFDCDTCCVFCGDSCPADCELYGGLAVWEGNEAPDVYYYEVTSDYNACNGVGSINDTDGSYTFNRSVTTSLDNYRNSVQTMFMLYDDDPLATANKDDMLGSDYDVRTASGSWNESNDAQLPSGYVVLEGTCTNETAVVENVSNLYTLNHTLTVSDATGPTGISIATPTDGTANSGWDDDFMLNWVWDKATDPHSGIGVREVDLWEAGSQAIVNIAPVCGATTCSITACGSSAGSCQLVWDIQDEETYHLQVAARNDDAATVDISNRRYARICSGGTQDGLDCTNDSSSCTGGGGTCPSEIDSEPVTVDRTAPTATFGSGTPTEGVWLRQAFTVYFDDFDINPFSCFHQVVVDGSGPDPEEWTTRSCSGSATITVGPAPSMCSFEGDVGDDVCRIYSRAVDAAGNLGQASRGLAIDFTPDEIGGLMATTEPDGTVIPDGAWSSDADPFVAWSTPTSTSPILGYSWAIGAADCVADTTHTSVDFSTSPLSDGSHVFQVRSVDEAGNCGPASSFMLNIDTTTDSVTAIRAYTEAGGELIPPDTPQPDDTPYVEWDTQESTAPVVGYSYELNTTPDCLVDTTATFVNLGPLPEGTTTFGVRALDQAGNCGSTSTFDLVVDSCLVSIFCDGFESGDTTAWQ